jgi:phytoene dehydrogenase-like protein
MLLPLLLLLLLLLQGLYSSSAGTHPGGSVAGCAGHNSAGCVVKDMGLAPWWQTA